MPDTPAAAPSVPAEMPCLTVFTVESIEKIKKNGGSVYWKVSQQRAMALKYAVLVQNKWKALAEAGDWDTFATDTPHEHGHAFMVGEIRDVVPANEPDAEDRYKIRFRAIAPLEPTIPDCWKGWRMPINYSQTIEGLGIDLSALVWETIELRSPPSEAPEPVALEDHSLGSLDGLDAVTRFAAAQFGVDVSKIEVSVRIRPPPLAPVSSTKTRSAQDAEMGL
jgi:hypothetical protein